MPAKTRSFSLPALGGGSGGGVCEVRHATAARPAAQRNSGTAALKPDRALSPTEALENLPFAPERTNLRAEARAIAAEKRAEAKAQGYEGEACSECGNFTLLRNGTCLKCNTCGGTTGCS